ncbi:MAG: CoA pyrophosphatase [Acidobacteriota bacterium]
MEAEAAVAVVYAALPVESVLLMRRSTREGDPWSGHWSFPGGRHEPTDADLIDTALRELCEECGVDLSRHQLDRAFPIRHAGQHLGRLIMVAPFLFRVDETFNTTPDGVEAEEAIWLPLSTLRNIALHEADAVAGLPGGRRMPGIPLRGVPLWGFTYRVLCEWLELPEPPGPTTLAGI